MKVESVSIDDVFPDESNPRKSDPVRMQLLRLSIERLGFVQPVFANEEGMILSGHQRHKVATEMGIEMIPVCFVDLSEKDEKGINVMFNRATNDFTAFDTGASASARIDIHDLMAQSEGLPVFKGENWLAYTCRERSIRKLGHGLEDKWNRKSLLIASTMRRKGIKIPIVITESGRIVNGVHRLFEALHEDIDRWPVIEIPDDLGDLALNLLNYLSMDYEVDGDFARMLRYSAYRRPQNNRGSLPKAMRFWANGNRTLRDRDSYSSDYWKKFRDLHGQYVCDFGAGLGKAGPFLGTKGIECVDFEPYRIDPEGEVQKPDPDFSRGMAAKFLVDLEEGRKFDSIFMCSVMNSIPFPEDRQMVLCIVHALCGLDTVVYGTCRDWSDFEYEYSGIRNATYFVFDSEPGVRLGDAASNPKIQKFHTQEEFKRAAGVFWKDIQTWPGGNVFYWQARYPKMRNLKALAKSLEFEFDLPYSDGSTMDLVDAAKAAFSKRLGVKVS